MIVKKYLKKAKAIAAATVRKLANPYKQKALARLSLSQLKTERKKAITAYNKIDSQAKKLSQRFTQLFNQADVSRAEYRAAESESKKAFAHKVALDKYIAEIERKIMMKKTATAKNPNRKKVTKKNRTIIKAKRIDHLDVSKIHNGRKKPARKRTRKNPYAYQVLYNSGTGFKPAGAFYAKSRTEALKQAERELKTKRLWNARTKLITAAAPLTSVAAKHVNPKHKPAAAKKTQKIFEKFNGRKSRKVAILSAPNGTPENTAKLGRLRMIRTVDGRRWHFEGTKAPFLAADTKGKLHVVGGAYKANPASQNCGEIERIEYETTKPHLGHTSPTVYFHSMGEEGGRRPTMAIDSEGLIKIRGGDYRIEADGIHN